MSDVLGMLGLGTGGTQDAIAMIDIPQDGFIIGIDWDCNAVLDAEENYAAELSFIATAQLLQNDVRGRISSISGQGVEITAVGHTFTSMQKWLGSFDISVSGGERLFLHVIATAGVTSITRCNLFIDFGGTVTRRSTRRR